MTEPFFISETPLSLDAVTDFVFQRGGRRAIAFSAACEARVLASYDRLQEWAEKAEPIYGVTTGFGDSCHRRIPLASSEVLQDNLIRYLLCGTGPSLPREATRATALLRLISLSRGYSGVSPALIAILKNLVERDWLPSVPREGSLGASGDLIPLAYIARAVQGQGEVQTPEGKALLPDLLAREGLAPYRLKPKEGLALVNGTSAMTGLGLVNLTMARFLTETSSVATAWLCMGLEGRTDPFGTLVNERAKSFQGQALAARWVRGLLDAEAYAAPERLSSEKIQDRYSLRCAPQIVGPVLDTLRLLEDWLAREINGASDNPLVAGDGELAMGGNFYGGYLSQGMDYLKICVGHLADLADRQIALIIDETTNRGLPPNLISPSTLPEEERFLHHGLKGLHQAATAITAEILSRTLSSGIFSRSTESHNQDKVSLGMSAAVMAHEILDALFRVQAMQLVCLAQAIDLRGRSLKSQVSRDLYALVRSAVPFVERDTPLAEGIASLEEHLKETARNRGRWFANEEA